MVDSESEIQSSSTPQEHVGDEPSFFDPYIDAVAALGNFVSIAWSGLQTPPKRQATPGCQVTLTEHTLRIERAEIDEASESTRIDRITQFSIRERETGFPYLYTLACVRLWTIIEALVQDLVLERLTNDPDSRKEPDLLRLKGPLVEFAEATKAQQAAFLVDALKQDLRVQLKPGVGQFEPLLKAVRLGGSVDALVKRTLFELSQIRNAIVHRNSIVDQRLFTECPWLQLQVGKSIHLTHADFERYMYAGKWYIVELSRRCGQISEASDVDEHDKMLVKFVNEIKIVSKVGKVLLKTSDEIS